MVILLWYFHVVLLFGGNLLCILVLSYFMKILLFLCYMVTHTYIIFFMSPPYCVVVFLGFAMLPFHACVTAFVSVPLRLAVTHTLLMTAFSVTISSWLDVPLSCSACGINYLWGTWKTNMLGSANSPFKYWKVVTLCLCVCSVTWNI